VSLGHDDNDPGRFFAHFVGTLRHIEPDIGGQALALLHSTQPQSAQAVLVALIYEIGANLEPFALVLDDYHEIENEAVHNKLPFLLDHLPLQMHLVIVSRVDRPLPPSALS